MSNLPAEETNSKLALNMASSLKENNQLFDSKLITLYSLYKKQIFFVCLTGRDRYSNYEFFFFFFSQGFSQPTSWVFALWFALLMWHPAYIVLDEGTHLIHPLAMPHSPTPQKAGHTGEIQVPGNTLQWWSAILQDVLESMLLHPGQFCPLEDMCQNLEIFLIVTTGREREGSFWHLVSGNQKYC